MLDGKIFNPNIGLGESDGVVLQHKRPNRTKLETTERDS